MKGVRHVGLRKRPKAENLARGVRAAIEFGLRVPLVEGTVHPRGGMHCGRIVQPLPKRST